MSWEQSLQTISLNAGADFASKQYLLADVNSSGNLIVAGIGSRPAGVIQDTPASGAACNLAIGGVTKVVLSGTIAAGTRVGPTSGGKVAAVGSTTGYSYGLLLVGGDVNNIGVMLIQPGVSTP